MKKPKANPNTERTKVLLGHKFQRLLLLLLGKECSRLEQYDCVKAIGCHHNIKEMSD
jgi:hypothetical protein